MVVVGEDSWREIVGEDNTENNPSMSMNDSGGNSHIEHNLAGVSSIFRLLAEMTDFGASTDTRRAPTCFDPESGDQVVSKEWGSIRR